MVGKSFCFGLAITSDNVTNGSDTFKVSEVWSGDYIQRIESLSEPVSLIETVSSTLSGGEVSGLIIFNYFIMFFSREFENLQIKQNHFFFVF